MVHLTPTSVPAEQPFGASEDQLYPHQLRMLEALRQLESDSKRIIPPDDPTHGSIKGYLTYSYNQVMDSPITIHTRLGVLSSPTGTGKTHPMVALAAQPYKSNGLANNYRVNMLVHMEGVVGPGQEYLPSTLIVVPKNIYPQWMRVVKQAGVFFHGVYDRADLDQLCSLIDSDSDWENNILMPRIVLVKHTLYNELAHKYHYWSRVIIDEADTINIPANRPIYAGFSWLVTATAEYLYNIRNRGYWRDIMSTMQGSVLKALEITIDQDYAAECLHFDRATHHKIRCQGIQNLEQVSQYLPDRIQEMLAVGDFNGAVKEMGGQTHDKESFIQVIINFFQKKIDSVLNQIKEAQLVGHKHDALDMRLASLEERKKGIIDQIQNITGKCAICHDQATDISMVQCCMQIYCTECILAWMSMKPNQECPTCRDKNPTIMKINQVEPTADSGATGGAQNNSTDGAVEIDDSEPIYNKYQTLPRLLEFIFKRDASSKVIVITSYNLHKFEQQLENNQYQFNILNHTSHKRTIKEYNQGTSPIILLDAKYNGAGIDLELTTDIIYMQDLAGNLMKQTIGRAIRLSRPFNLPLRVYYLQEGDEGDSIDRYIRLNQPIPQPRPRPKLKLDSPVPPNPAPKIALPRPKIKII